MHIECGHLLVLPHHPGVSCRNEAEPLPSPDPVCVCLHAFRPVGVGLRPLRCLWALESSANHSVPFLPLCCHSAAFSFCSSSKLNAFFVFCFLPPSRRICWGTYRTERGYGSLISIYPKWPGSKKKEEEKEDPVQTRTCDLHASLYDSAQPKESACEAYLSCAAGSDQINWGLFVCMCACVCVWVNISVKAQRYKPNITQWHVFTSRKTWLKTSQACWSYDAALRSLEGGKSWFTDKKRFLLMRFLFFSSLRFELFFSMHVHWWHWMTH